MCDGFAVAMVMVHCVLAYDFPFFEFRSFSFDIQTLIEAFMPALQIQAHAHLKGGRYIDQL